MYPIGSKVVPFCGLYLGSYKVTPKRNYFGAYGYRRYRQTHFRPPRSPQRYRGQGIYYIQVLAQLGVLLSTNAGDSTGVLLWYYIVLLARVADAEPAI